MLLEIVHVILNFVSMKKCRSTDYVTITSQLALYGFRLSYFLLSRLHFMQKGMEQGFGQSSVTLILRAGCILYCNWERLFHQGKCFVNEHWAWLIKQVFSWHELHKLEFWVVFWPLHEEAIEYVRRFSSFTLQPPVPLLGVSMLVGIGSWLFQVEFKF